MLELIDISSMQGHVDWEAVRRSGIVGAYIKSSQYSSTVDYAFGTYVSGCRKEKLLYGAYHFAWLGGDPIKQARFFYEACFGIGSAEYELPPMVDIEFAKDINSTDQVLWLMTFLEEAEKLWYPYNTLRMAQERVCRLPGVYTYPNYADGLQPALGAAEGLSKYPLWLASGPHYADAAKANWFPTEDYIPPHKAPKPWEHITLNQYSGNGGQPVPGISRTCDRDIFLGSSAEWDIFRGVFREPDAIEVPAHIESYPALEVMEK